MIELSPPRLHVFLLFLARGAKVHDAGMGMVCVVSLYVVVSVVKKVSFRSIMLS